MRISVQVATLGLVLSLGFGLAGSTLADDAVKSPLEHAKVGQWTRYRIQADSEMKQAVVKVEGRKITIKTQMWIKGAELPSAELPVDLDKKTDPNDKKPPEAKVEEGTQVVNGKTLKCRVHTQDKMKTWFSDDVPIMGIVRQELDGKPTMELLAWGDKADEDKGRK
jgi:hypothetical protein